MLGWLAATQLVWAVSGEDPASAARLHGAVQASLSRTPDVAARAATLPSESTWPAKQAEAARLHAEGSKAFYEDRQIAALDRFAALMKVQESSTGVPTARRVNVRLWRAMIYLVTGEEKAAETEAREALALDPELTVDTTEFRPSLKALVSELRPKLVPVEIEVRATPAHATLTVDDRRVSSRFAVVEGRHWLRATAAGYAPAEIAFEAKRGTVVDVSLEGASDPRIALAVWGPPRVDLVESGADAVLFAASRVEPAAECRATIAWRGRTALQSPAFPDDEDGRAALVAWIASQLGDRPRLATARNPASRTGTKPLHRRPTTWVVATAVVALAAGVALTVPADRETRTVDADRHPGAQIPGWGD